MRRVIAAVFSSFGSEHAFCADRKKWGERAWALFENLLELIIDGTINGRNLIDCVTSICEDLSYLPASLLARCAKEVGDSLTKTGKNTGKQFKILPKLLSLLDDEDMLNLADVYLDSMSGGEYVNHVIDNLCKATWAPGVCLEVLDCLKDMDLAPNQLDRCIRKVFQNVTSVTDVDTLPALVYQFLLLANKGHNRLVLKAVVTHLDRLDRAHFSSNSVEPSCVGVKYPYDKLTRSQGTIMVYFDFALKQDPSIMKELLRLLKTRSLPLTCFAFSLLLSSLKVPHCKWQVFGFLKTYTIEYFEHITKQYSRPWLLRILKQ